MEDKKKESEQENNDFEIDSSSIIENIDYEKLAELMSDENFLQQFLESISSSSKKEGTKRDNDSSGQAEMSPPDLTGILDNI